MCGYSVRIYVWQRFLHSIQSLLTSNFVRLTCIRTGQYRRMCARWRVCFFMCRSQQNHPHTILRSHILYFILLNLKIARWMGSRNSLSKACLLVYLPVRYDSLCSQCTQHYVCTFKMLFIYCNLVARHFVNVYDISHSSKGFEIYIHHTWCRHRHRTHTDYTWS